MDELNEFLNLWNKSCVSSSNFETSCERSKHILALRNCAFDAFVRRNSILQNRALGQQESDVVKLINFFELVDIFPKDYNVKRKMTKDFCLNKQLRKRILQFPLAHRSCMTACAAKNSPVMILVSLNLMRKMKGVCSIYGEYMLWKCDSN